MLPRAGGARSKVPVALYAARNGESRPAGQLAGIVVLRAWQQRGGLQALVLLGCAVACWLTASRQERSTARV